MFETKFVEKIKTHILCSVTFFYENRAVYEIMWKKYCRAGQTTLHAGYRRLQIHAQSM